MVFVKFYPQPGDKRGDHLFFAAILVAVCKWALESGFINNTTTVIICAGYLSVFVIIYRRKYRARDQEEIVIEEADDSNSSMKTLGTTILTLDHVKE